MPQVGSKTLEDQLRDDLYGAIDEVSAAHESSDRASGLPHVSSIRWLPVTTVAFASAESKRIAIVVKTQPGPPAHRPATSGGPASAAYVGAKAKIAEDVGQPFLLNRAPSPI